MPKIATLFFTFLLIFSLISCVKKSQEINSKQEIAGSKKEIAQKARQIPFATSKKEMDAWYKKYFDEIISSFKGSQDSKGSKDSKSAKNAKGAIKIYESFAKLYFADIAKINLTPQDLTSQNLAKPQTQDKNKNLAQSTIATYFLQEFFKEFLFIESQEVKIAPWSEFSSQIKFIENLDSARFVLRIARGINTLESQDFNATQNDSKRQDSINIDTINKDIDEDEDLDSIQTLEHKSLVNYNNILLANALLALSNKYTFEHSVLAQSREITELKSYKLPPSIKNLLYFRILYFKYNEKFVSNYLLDRLSIAYPQEMLSMLNSIMTRKFSDDEIRSYFRFQSYDRTLPLSIWQCKGLSDFYPYIQPCVEGTFLPWIAYLRRALRELSKDFEVLNSFSDSSDLKDKKDKAYALPIYIDSTLCLLISENKTILYPQNKSRVCKILYDEILRRKI